MKSKSNPDFMKKQSKQSRGVRSKVSEKQRFVLTQHSDGTMCLGSYLSDASSLLSCYLLQYCAPQFVRQVVFSLVLEGCHVSVLSVSLSLNRSHGIADTLMVGMILPPAPAQRCAVGIAWCRSKHGLTTLAWHPLKPSSQKVIGLNMTGTPSLTLHGFINKPGHI